MGRLSVSAAILILFATTASAVDVNPGDIVVAMDDPVSWIKVDSATGDRTVISGCADPACSSIVGSGPLSGGTAVAVLPDGRILGRDLDQGILLIDPSTGDRTVLSGCDGDTLPNCTTGTIQGSGPLVAGFWSGDIEMAVAPPPLASMAAAVTALPGWALATLFGFILGVGYKVARPRR